MLYAYQYKRLRPATSGISLTELMMKDSHSDPMANLPNPTTYSYFLSFFHKNGCPYDAQNDSDRNHRRNHNNAIPKV
jgi:hypothetical protein